MPCEWRKIVKCLFDSIGWLIRPPRKCRVSPYAFCAKDIGPCCVDDSDIVPGAGFESDEDILLGICCNSVSGAAHDGLPVSETDRAGSGGAYGGGLSDGKNCGHESNTCCDSSSFLVSAIDALLALAGVIGPCSMRCTWDDK